MSTLTHRWSDASRGGWPTTVLRVAIATLASLVMVAAVVATNGNVMVAAALPIGLGAGVAMLTNPGRTFSLLLFCALLFEQYQIFGLDPPVTLQIPFFENFNNSIGVPLPTNPVEVLLVMMASVFLLTQVVTRRFAFQAHNFQLPMLVFALLLATFMAYGVAKGGPVNIGLWEVRALFYLCLTYFVGSQLVRTHKDVVFNTWMILIPVAIKGFQGVWRYAVDLKFDIGDVPAITSHECAVFIMTSFVFTLAMILFRGDVRMIAFTAITAPTTFITFIWAQRRIAYGALVFGIIILFCFLPKDVKKRFVMKVLPLIPIIALYFAVFWNSTSSAAMPVQQVRSIFGTDATGVEDSSNTYRDDEKINLVYTIRQAPLGRGFAQKYLIIKHLDEVDFPLWDYIPHNCILWFWAKTGFIGMITFFVVFGLWIIHTAVEFRYTTRPLYKALQVVLIVFLVNQVIVAYYDLQLTFYRNMVYLGAFMATMVPISREAQANRRRLERGETPTCR